LERITMRPVGASAETPCWHCQRPIHEETGLHAARYLYRSEQPQLAVVEDWIHCECGAYQNVRHLSEITIETFGRPINKTP